MNRRVFVGAISAIGAAGFVAYAQPTEEQINDLEAEVAALDERVSALETQAASEGQNEDGASTDPEESDSGASESGLAFEGGGETVTDKFELAAGNYRVLAIVDVAGDFDGFSVFVYDPSGNQDLLFNEIIESSGVAEFEAVYEAPDDGDYYAEVGNTGSAWTLEFSPL